jgi:hypothetical protein
VIGHASEGLQPQRALDKLIEYQLYTQGALRAHFNSGVIELYNSKQESDREKEANRINNIIGDYSGFCPTLAKGLRSKGYNHDNNFYCKIESDMPHDPGQRVMTNPKRIGNVLVQVSRDHKFLISNASSQQVLRELSLKGNGNKKPFQVRASSNSPWIAFFDKNVLYLGYLDADDPAGFDICARLWKNEMCDGHGKERIFHDVSLAQGSPELVFSIQEKSFENRPAQEHFYGISHLLEYYVSRRSILAKGYKDDFSMMQQFRQSLASDWIKKKQEMQKSIERKIRRHFEVNQPNEQELLQIQQSEDWCAREAIQIRQEHETFKKEQGVFCDQLKGQIKEVEERIAERRSLHNSQVKLLGERQNYLKKGISDALSDMGF